MRPFHIIIGISFMIGLSACQPSKPTPQPKPSEVTLTFNAENPIEWILEDVRGATDVGSIGAKNPALTLTVGTRYIIINKTGFAHPFQLLDEFSILLSENGSGSFETNAAVKFEKNNNGFSFTLSQELANSLDKYNCALHSSMTGNITIKSSE